MGRNKNTETKIFGKMTVSIKNGKAIEGMGTVSLDNSGQEWFDYDKKPFPSRLDWKEAGTLSFKPDIGKVRNYSASETEYFFSKGLGWS